MDVMAQRLADELGLAEAQVGERLRVELSEVVLGRGGEGDVVAEG